jgi:hypothetical protein
VVATQSARELEAARRGIVAALAAGDYETARVLALAMEPLVEGLAHAADIGLGTAASAATARESGASKGATVVNKLKIQCTAQRDAEIVAAWADLKPQMSERARCAVLTRRHGWPRATIVRALGKIGPDA